ncbi:MAG TPA: branched-chain amino acid ABC transporter permease [Gaiellaceae bacterium]|nr:branched-chain amino acid ABC transporter permease [Gaiellaceae bacterium]
MLLAIDWTELAQQTVIGLSSGGLWALLALAIVLIYRSTGVINFAQGEMAMFSTFIAWSLINHGLSYWEAFLLTLAISFAGGIGIERAVIRPVERAPVLTIVIVTIGLLFVVDGAARWFWSSETRSLPNAFSTRPITIAGVAFSIQDLGNIAVSLGVVALLAVLFRFTKVGLALRASAVNPEESRLLGIRVSWMLALGWGLAAAMGAVSGMLTAPALASFDQNLMQPVLLYALAGAVLGGLESPLGAVVGSLLLGVFVNLTGTYIGWIGTDLRLPLAFAVILGVLLVRPSGLFGRPSVRRV